MPESSVPLLGRDILSKLQAVITFVDRQIQVRIPEDKIVDAQVFVL